mmetsp:Transcript_41825/g.124971  ORF Transcript_41825/g.124971 Transcript_41825/m.124971 type:complete len:208 (-) Transcript_41825:33-656(-)
MRLAGRRSCEAWHRTDLRCAFEGQARERRRHVAADHRCCCSKHHGGCRRWRRGDSLHRRNFKQRPRRCLGRRHRHPGQVARGQEFHHLPGRLGDHGPATRTLAQASNCARNEDCSTSDAGQDGACRCGHHVRLARSRRGGQLAPPEFTGGQRSGRGDRPPGSPSEIADGRMPQSQPEHPCDQHGKGGNLAKLLVHAALRPRAARVHG